MKNPVRKTTLKVVRQAKEVKINQEAIKKIAENWIKEKVKVPSWPTNFHLQTKNQRKILDYLILLDSLNFCFWSKKEKWQITYKGGKYNGYFAFSLALKKFFEENPEKANLNYFPKISFKEFKEVFQGGKNLILLKERWEIARTVSSVIVKKYSNSENFINSANQKFSVLVPKIHKELPYFNDVSFYKGEKVYFLKRAQILGAEILGAFKGQGIGCFKDPGYLTCFPDYKVPQVLHHLRILEYSPNLEKKIKNKIIIPHNSKAEIEIRSATVCAVEYLRDALAELGKKFYSFEIDWILWNKGRELKIETPYHLTKTIFY